MLNTYVVATRPLTPCGAAPHRAGRGHAVGHGTAVSLRALDSATTGSSSAAAIGRPCRNASAARRSTEGTRGVQATFVRLYPGAGGRRARLAVGRVVRHDAGRAALHRPASPLSASAVRARVRRQRHDVRLPRRPPAARLVPRRSLSGPRSLRVRSVTLRLESSDFRVQISEFRFRLRPFDFDRAFREHRRQGADRGEDRGDDGADDADGQRELGDRPARPA